MTKYVVMLEDKWGEQTKGEILPFFPSHTTEENGNKIWHPDFVKRGSWRFIALPGSYEPLTYKTEQERVMYKMLYPDWEEEWKS